MNEEALSLDPERQETAREYARISRRWMVIELALSLGLVVGFWATGLSRWLKAFWLSAGFTAPAALVGAYIATLAIGYTLAMMPLAWWTGFVLPHRYKLSTQTRRGWLVDQLKMATLELTMGIPVAEIIYWLLRIQPDTWWIWAAGFMIVLSIGMGALYPVLIVPLFYKLTPLDDPELVERIRRLAEKAARRVAEVATIDLSSRTTTANAAVFGLGSSRRIALSDTLYADFTHDEIETILAHELGHQVHHDLELGVIVQSAVTVAGLYAAHWALRWGIARFGFDGPADIAALPYLTLVAGFFSFVTMPLLNGYSRRRERLADRYAAEITGKPQIFANALTRLGNQNLAEADPPRWVGWLLYSHPPLRERIQSLQRVPRA